MRFLTLVLTIVFILLPDSAYAKWKEARSDHFIVYADQSETKILAFTDRLERYHNAMRSLYGGKERPLSDANKVTIFVVKDTDKVALLAGNSKSNIAGFYIPRAGGPVAFVPEIERLSSGSITFGEQVLYHEYAHHFQNTNLGTALPLWFTEGFAEFFSSSRFNEDGSVDLGLPNQHRGAELTLVGSLPLDIMLDGETLSDFEGSSRASLYGRAWLLFHYLTFSSQRSGQIAQYATQLLKGGKDIDVARSVFGDLDALDTELNKYERTRDWTYIPVSAATTEPNPINVRTIRDGEADIMDTVMKSHSGFSETDKDRIAEVAKSIAEKHPNEPVVLAALAHAYYNNDAHEAAIMAANAALKLDPKNMQALVQKLYATYSLALAADEAQNDTGDWNRVLETAVAANTVDGDNPVPLYYFYLALDRAEPKLPADAKIALERAFNIAPYDRELRFALARQKANDREYSLARGLLRPLFSRAHGSAGYISARKLQERMKGLADGQPLPPEETEADTATS